MIDGRGGAVDLRGLTNEPGEDPGGAGGASGGGTAAGAGQPSGATLDSDRGEAGAPVREPDATGRRDSLAGITGSEEAAEAAVLGPADGELSDASGRSQASPGAFPSGGETVGAGAGTGEPGAGTPPDHGGLGGGDPLAPPNPPA